jgi:hypothetical protein
MKQLTSLHLSNDHLRILKLSSLRNSWSFDGCHIVNIPNVSHLPNLDQLDMTAYLPNASGSLVITLGGGLFHIQRVPLEVASETDRIAQIHWEASQVLIDPIEHYVIDFLPSGRVAFWTAIRKEITETYSEYFLNLGFDTISFVPEPLALLGLCKYNSTHQNHGAIWLGQKWGSFVAQNNEVLTTIETVHLYNKAHNDPRILSQIKHWIQGDLNAERRRPTFDHVLLCGETHPIATLSESLSEFKTPRIVPFNLSDHLQNVAIEGDAKQEAHTFALALGAAMVQAQ